MYKKGLFLLSIVVLMAVCATSVIYAGGKWNILKNMDIDWSYSAIAFVSSSEGWVVGNSPFDQTGYIGHTNDGGQTWEKAEIDVEKSLSNVYFFDKKNGWAVGDGGMIVATKDGGKRWDLQTSKVGNWLYGVHFVSDKVGYAVGMGETMLKTKGGGKTWKILRGGEMGGAVGDQDTVVFNAIQFIDESTGWVTGVKLSPTTGGQDGIVEKTTDAGETWVNQPTNVPDILKDIFFIDDSNGWVVGENGVVLHSTDGGDTWNLQTSGTEENLESVRFVDKNVGWAAGGALGVNVIIYTSDGGETWENQSVTDDPIVSKQPITDVAALDESHIWVTGPSGVVMSYSK